MVSWLRMGPGARSEWTTIVNEARDWSPFQSYAWGEYKRNFGWEPEHWVARDEKGRLVGGLQCLKKRLPLRRVLIWAPGGPLTGFSGSGGIMPGDLLRAWLAEFRRGNGLVYARFRSHNPISEKGAWNMNQACSRPVFRINSGWTIQFDLSKSLAELRSAMTSKHRYYAKQSEKAGIQWKVGSSQTLLADAASLYQEMCRTKGIGRIALDPSSLGELSRQFGGDCLLLVGYRDTLPVTSCLTLKTGSKAFYLLAATGPEGRKISAAYAMVWKLFEVLKGEGVVHFDFGGIDPTSPSAAGVDHFKKGFGGKIVEYLGEWEWAVSRVLRWGANFMIKNKKTL